MDGFEDNPPAEFKRASLDRSPDSSSPVSGIIDIDIDIGVRSGTHDI